MTDATAEFFDALAQSGHEPLLEKAKGTVSFELTNGKQVERWLVAVDDGDVTVSRRNTKADCTVRVKKDLFEAIAAGEANAMAAFLRGEVAIAGEMELMALLQRVFPGPPTKRPRRRNGGSGERSS
jgi:putative sterol carrier protein